MSLFDLKKISDGLIDRKSIVWFSDIPTEKKTLSAEVTKRITECAESWNGYIHVEFEDRYCEFAEIKNRSNYEDPYINRRACLMDMAFYEIFIGGGKYLDRIEDMTLRILGEKTWCVPSHYKTKTKETTNHVIELYAAETAAVLAIVHHFLGEKLSPSTNDAIVTAIEERMFVPFTETDKYGWMGADGRPVNNWNPWINSNVILTAALTCRSEETYRALTMRALSFTENYIRSLSDDCLCDEGVRYFALSGACLFDIAEIVFDITGGAVDLTSSREVKQACDYITGMYDEYGNPANFADATIDFYPQCATLTRQGERTGNPTLANMGRALYRPDALRIYHDNFYRQMKDLYTASHITKAEAINYPEAKYLKSINVFTVRRDGFFLSFKANHNGESHNHNDTGNFVIYYKGTPIFIDAGVDFYSGYTFSKDRYDLWYMRSDYHNLPSISGKLQHEGKEYVAGEMKISGTRAEADISGAYGITDQPWIRSAEIKDGCAIITDSFKNSHGTVLNYILKDAPTIEGNKLIFKSGICAELSGVSDVKLTSLDVTGKNPPDNIIGDAANRKEGRSYLIPRMMNKQWGKSEIYKLTAIPISDTVTLKVYDDHKRGKA